MSLHKQWHLTCDGCGKNSSTFNNGTTMAEAQRGSLGKAGWASMNRGLGRFLDYCPECAAAQQPFQPSVRRAG